MEKYRLVGERRPDGETQSKEDSRKPPAAPFSSSDIGLPQDESKEATTSEGGEAEQGSSSGGSGSSSPSEVRITQQGKPRNYISYAMSLFEQHGADTITLKAMGRAINKCVTITEILKRKMPLHQITKLSSEEIIDIFEPLEEGLDIVESKRYVSCIVVTLSKTGNGMNTNDIGYQPPLPLEEIMPGDLNKASFDRSKTPTAGSSGLPPTDSASIMAS